MRDCIENPAECRGPVDASVVDGHRHADPTVYPPLGGAFGEGRGAPSGVSRLAHRPVMVRPDARRRAVG